MLSAMSFFKIVGAPARVNATKFTFFPIQFIAPQVAVPFVLYPFVPSSFFEELWAASGMLTHRTF